MEQEMEKETHARLIVKKKFGRRATKTREKRKGGRRRTKEGI